MMLYKQIKKMLGCACLFIMVLLISAPCAFPELYRFTVDIDTTYCSSGCPCELLGLLSLTPGSTADFLVDYTPVRTFFVEDNDCCGRHTLLYETQDPLVTKIITAIGTEYDIQVLSYSDHITLRDYPSGSIDSVILGVDIEHASCPSLAPCLNDLLPQNHMWNLALVLRRPSGTDDDLRELPAVLDLSKWTESALFQIFDLYSDYCDGGLQVSGTISEIHRMAPEMLTALVDQVMELNVKSGISNALDAKLDSALEALDDVNAKNDVSACNRIQAFINAVEAQRGTQLTDSEADDLIAAAQEIITAFSCQ